MNNKRVWTFNNLEFEKNFIGPLNQNIYLIASELEISIDHINNYLLVDENIPSDKESMLNALLQIISSINNQNIKWGERDLIHILKYIKQEGNTNFAIEKILDFYEHKKVILNTYDGRKITAKTLMQRNYIELLDTSSIIFVTGSAGTGKTFLAVAYAVNALKKNLIKKIIITRPAVEAGEKLGFLPGDLKEKVDPYLIPIYDALNDFLGKETVDRLVEKQTIEIAPLAYMRGRTLDNAIIILDEAQNTTSNQMKMFITRLGFNSKMIITGDQTQIDLQNNERSGLLEATNILRGIKGISHMAFTKYDVMRHPLVTKVLERYEAKNRD